MKNVEDQDVATILERAKVLERNEVPHPAIGDRILRNLRSELDAPPSPRRVRAWLLAPAAVAAAAIVGFVLLGRGVTEPTATAPRASAGLKLEATDEPSQVDLPDFGTIRLAPTTKMSVEPMRTLELGLGSARIAAAPTVGERWLVAGPVRIAFTSARFEITRTEEALSLEVHDGAVEAHVETAQTTVRAGETWRHDFKLPAPASLGLALERLEADDVDGALEIYERLADNDDPTAEIAQYYRARLLWRSRGHVAEALDALREMTARFPNGAMQIDAALLRMTILADRGRCEEVRALAARTARRFGHDAVEGADRLCVNAGAAPTTKKGR